MSWPRYSDYKPSGVSWVGEIPHAWDLVNIRYLCTIRTGDKDTVNSDPNGEYPFFVRSQTVERIPTWSFSGEAVLTAGDGAGVGKVFHYVDGKFDAHQRVYVFNKFRRVRARYFYYYLSTLFAKVALDGSAKSTVDSLRRPMLTDFPVCVPDIATQDTILEFLGRELARIDALIAKQERLIATLREDRTATITHAVTKGLDLDVEMTDSGVKWLGEIPRHWVACRLKNIIRSTESGTSVNAGDWPAGADEVGVLKTSSVSAGWFNDAANKTVVDQDEIDRVSCPVRADSLLVNRANTPLLVGSAGYAATDHDSLFLSDKLWQVRFNDSLAQFVYYWTRTEVYRSQIAALCVGASSSMQNLAMTDFRNIAIALPPMDEQVTVVNFLSNRTAKIDSLIDKSADVIRILTEYRTALVTDAVTGKIDVREVVA